MGDISRNISRTEVACKCGKCGFQTADIETVEIVQSACDYFAVIGGGGRVVLDIHSWCRCEYWNGHEKGARNSTHRLAIACDHSIRNVTPEELYAFYDSRYSGKYAFIVYDTFVHADCRAGMYRADRRAEKRKAKTPILLE